MNRIAVMKPWLGEEEIAAVTEVMCSGWVAQGPRVAEFESAFARSQQCSHAVAVSSCTAALHLALIVAGIGAGDDVVVPSFSFIATANAAVYVGARPVFADVDLVTGNVTAETVLRALTPNTTAVIVVDQGGVPVDLDSIRAVTDPLGIIVIEDAACGVGSTYLGRPVGSRAELTVWSFHPRKILTTGEGGMLTTISAAHADRARRLREHAMSVSAAERHLSALAPAEVYTEVGYNYRMTDLQAAVGLVQLQKLPTIIERRRRLAARYTRAIESIDGLRAVADPSWGTTNFQSFWLEVLPEYPLNRDQLLAKLAENDVSARRGIMAAHRQPAYGRPGPEDALDSGLSNTARLTDSTLILPLYHQLTMEDHDRVIGALQAPAPEAGAVLGEAVLGKAVPAGGRRND
ncbi:MAG: glutamine--scyllo-inositol aminotransferase [Subtercola sp.]|nr:glutamine--scyllo-inositol aminotransferase [Subtercola sp.]